MKLFHLLLITSFLGGVRIHALPASTDSNEAKISILRRSNAFWRFWDAVPPWFGFGGDDSRVVNLGTLECESDPNWRKTGFCAKAGKYFPKDGGVMPNAMAPHYLPAIPNHWRPDPVNPKSPDDVTEPNGPLAGGRANGPPPVLPAAEYPLPGGSVYKAPSGLPSTWNQVERMSFYNNVCVTDALGMVMEGPHPRGALLDVAGIEVCDDVEGELFDVSDEMEEAQELQEAAEAAEDVAENLGSDDPIQDWLKYSQFGHEDIVPGSGLSDGGKPEVVNELMSNPISGKPGVGTPKAINDINDGMNHPESDKSGEVTTTNLPGGSPPDDLMMSGGLSPESVASSGDTLNSIKNGPRWKRSFRRTLRKYRLWYRRRNANGFFDPEATKHMNQAFGLERDPILKGPGPEDDATYVRPSEEEKMIQAMQSIASMPSVPLILPEGYSWVPAERAEFGDNFEAVKRFAVMMGRDPLLKAMPTPENIFKMPYGLPGKDYTTRLLGMYGFHGTMVTPEVFSHFHWRTQDWLRNGKPKPGDCPWWFREYYAKPASKKLKNLFPKKTHIYWALAGIVAAAWGIIGGVHSQHEKHMEELKVDHQKWAEPMKEGYGPWILKESPITTTIDGMVQVSILTEYTQYSPFSTTELSLSEIAEMMGPVVTTTLTATEAGMTAAAGAAALMTPAAAMTPAAPEYAGIFRPEPLTVNMPVTAMVLVKPSPTPEVPRLNYVEPNRLLEMGAPLKPPENSVAVDDEPHHPPILPLYSDPTFIVLTRPPRPTHKGHGAYVNGTYTNGTAAAAAANSTDGDTYPSANSTSAPFLHGPTQNHTFPSSLSAAHNSDIQKAPHNVTTPNPYRLPIETSSVNGYGHVVSNGTYKYPNGTHRYTNSTREHGNTTTKPHGKLAYLKGSAPWDGVVVPEFPDAVPTGDGSWMCLWVPGGAK